MDNTYSTLDTGEDVPMPKVPKSGELTMQDVLGVREPFIPKKQNLESQLSQADLAIEEGKQQQKITEARGISDVTKRAAEQERTAQEDYQKQLIAEPLPAFIPTKDSVKDIATLFSTVSVMGMLLGGAGKLNAMQALNAMNGMLEGHQKGRSDLYKKQATEFDKNFKAMTKRHEELRKKMEDAVKLVSVDKEAGMAEAKLAAAESGSSIIKTLVDRGEIVRALQTLNDTVQGREAALKLVLTEQDRAATRKATADREKSAERRHTETLASQERMRRATLAAAQGRRDEKALQAIGPALRNIAENYAEGSADKLVGASTEDKKIVQGAYRAVEESEQVADFIAKNPKAVGAMAAIKNFIKMDAIKSIKNEDEGAAAVEKSQAVDAAIDRAVQSGSIAKDDAEAAKILQKKLFGLALSDVRGSGQRGSVYLDRQFQNLYDQASRQDTLINIIKERAEENNRNLRVYKLNVERHNNPELFPLMEAKSTNDYIKERAPKSGVPEKIEAALKGKPDGTGARSGGKTYRVYGGVIKEVQE
jgi:hypothetical protein